MNKAKQHQHVIKAFFIPHKKDRKHVKREEKRSKKEVQEWS
ncbi:MAG: hypothetical protein ACK5ND_01480 [Bacteroides sp.]